MDTVHKNCGNPNVCILNTKPSSTATNVPNVVILYLTLVPKSYAVLWIRIRRFFDIPRVEKTLEGQATRTKVLKILLLNIVQTKLPLA